MISFTSFFLSPSGITGLHDNLFSLSRFVHSSPCCTAVAMGFSSVSAQPPMLSHCPTGFYGLHSSVISWYPDCSPAFVEMLWNSPSAGSHQCGVKRAHHSSALGQAVLCKPPRIVLVGFTAISHCKLMPIFLLAVLPQVVFFMFCLILLLCRYLLVISHLCSGLFCPRNAML